jgi:DNA repair exonuclease SbcCD ATPase subunit
LKAKKNVLDTLDAFKGGKISQDQAKDSIKKEIEELKKAKEELFKEFKVGKDHLEETSENVKKYVDDCEKLITNVNTKIDNLTECFLLMVNNNSTLVRKGVSGEINKRLKGGAGVEKPQKL